MTRTEALERVAEAAREVRHKFEVRPWNAEAITGVQNAFGEMYRTLNALDAADSEDGWRLCSAMLPPIGEYVLIFLPDDDRRKVREAVRMVRHEGANAPWWWASAAGEILPEHVEKWRPLPAPPPQP